LKRCHKADEERMMHLTENVLLSNDSLDLPFLQIAIGR
jgi:hypothetical protein